jgi:glycosyltransferase involved in cell wall biosynthesis
MSREGCTGPARRSEAGGRQRGVRPKVLHCVYSGLGGHAAVLFTLLDERMRAEFDHFVLFFGVEDLRDDYARSCTRLGIPFAFVRKRGRIALRSHHEVLRTIGRFNPDLVMINGTPLAIPILGSRLLRRQQWSVVVRESQTNDYKTRAEWFGSLTAACCSDAVVYLTEEYRADIQRRFRVSRRFNARARVIPNGVDLDRYGARRAAEPGITRLAMVGRLVPLKNHSALIDAMAILVNEKNCAGLRLTIAGDGPELADLQRRTASQGLADVISFSGPLSGSDVADLLSDVDIYVHCTFAEAMSNSILQAMASELPIVASNVKGVSNILRHGEDAILVPVDNPVALADALEKLVRRPDMRRSLGQRARQRADEEFSQLRVAEEYRRLFRSLTCPAP